MMLQAANISTSEANEICSVWKKVVSGVHSVKHESETSDKRMPIGERLAGNTRVIDLKNGVLLVETDHPGWTQKMQFHKNFILTGLKNAFPELKIRSMSFRLRGDMFQLKDVQKEEVFQKTPEQKQTEKQISERIDQKNKNLPPELALKLEKLKNTILTKE